MTKIEIIQGLIDETERLQYKDGTTLDLLLKKIEMVIENIFGNQSHYLGKLEDIQFYPPVWAENVNEDDRRESWDFGKTVLTNLLKTMLEDVKLFHTTNKANNVMKDKDSIQSSKRIFIVHGHDEAMRESVARVVEKLGLKPIILHEQPNIGRTIIEKFTDYSDVSFAIVLLSPDDEGYPKNQPENSKYRARQNVIFELGFFIGKLGRDRVIALYKQDKNFEIPSDYSGVLYIPYDNSRKWGIELIKELKSLGYDVDANKLFDN